MLARSLSSAASRLSAHARPFQVRGMAAAAANVKPPMEMPGVSGRYASALWLAAFKAGSLDKVEKDLGEFGKAMKSNATVKMYVLDPAVNRKDKAENLMAGMKGSNELSRNFIGVLAENGRLGEVEGCIEDYSKLMKAHRKEVDAIITTAEPLDAEDMADVQAAVSTMVEKDEKVSITQKVDPALLGGFVIAVGDKWVDMSVARRIRDVEKLLMEPLN
jgi:F-type H+-transporting ATPase subunit O